MQHELDARQRQAHALRHISRIPAHPLSMLIYAPECQLQLHAHTKCQPDAMFMQLAWE